MNATYHYKTKPIDIYYHFVRDIVGEKKVLLVKVDSQPLMQVRKKYVCKQGRRLKFVVRLSTTHARREAICLQKVCSGFMLVQRDMR